VLKLIADVIVNGLQRSWRCRYCVAFIIMVLKQWILRSRRIRWYYKVWCL